MHPFAPSFTPLSATVGGLLIGLAVAALWMLDGRQAGVSGIAGGLFSPRRGEVGWRLWFLGGLVGGGLVLAQLHPSWFAFGAPRSTAALVGAGLLVGFGTRLGGGCTSGHGLCGVSRLAPRSIVATCVFVALGMIVVTVARHVGGAW